jgi:hypothetical protein
VCADDPARRTPLSELKGVSIPQGVRPNSSIASVADDSHRSASLLQPLNDRFLDLLDLLRRKMSATKALEGRNVSTRNVNHAGAKGVSSSGIVEGEKLPDDEGKDEPLPLWGVSSNDTA